MEKMYIGKGTRLTSVKNETQDLKLPPFTLEEDILIISSTNRIVDFEMNGEYFSAICGKGNRITQEGLNLRNRLLAEKETLLKKQEELLKK